MLTLSEHLDHKFGTYFALQPSGTTRNILQVIAQEYDINGSTKPLEYHTTVIYSKKPCPEMRKHDPQLPIWGTASGFELFGDDKNVLVVRINSVQLQKLYDDLQIYGPTSDYPEYKPHITLSYNWKGDCPRLKETFSIMYNSHVCSALED